MANAIYEQARETGYEGGLNWAAGDYRAVLAKTDTVDGLGIAITGATAATPIVITTASAPATGAVVSIQGVTGNTAANGHFRVQNLTGTQFAIFDYLTDAAVVGAGVFGGTDPNFVQLDGTKVLSSGVPAAARLATLPASIANKGQINGAADADNWTWLAVGPDGGNDGDCVIVYEHTGNESTSALLLFISLATGLPVFPNGGDISFVVSSGVHRLFRF